MKLIITGSTEIKVRAEDISKCIDSLNLAPTKILSPGFAGPSQAGITYAMRNGIPFKIFSDERATQNKDLVDECDALLVIGGSELIDLAGERSVHVFTEDEVRAA